MNDATSYVSLTRLAKELALPRAWLKREADAGRIPSLHIHCRRRFNVSQVERTLAMRAAKGGAS